MKKNFVFLMILTVMGMMSCESSKKSESGAAEKAVVEAPAKTKKIVVARAVVKSGQEAAFIEVAKILQEATRKEPGCQFYTLYQSPTDPTSFIFYEEYKNEDAFATHANSDHFKAFAGAIGDLLAEELSIEQF